LVKEAEKEFETILAKGEQADAVKKEAEETSQIAEDAKKEAEDLKKENETLKKENDDLKKQVEESEKLKDESNGLLAAITEGTRRAIPYEKYEELRKYAIKATKLYSKMKNNHNMLQLKIQEIQRSERDTEHAQMVQYQKDSIARARVEELRQRNVEARILSENRLKEAQEAEFMRNVNSDVLEYYNDTIARGVNISEFRTQILSKRTLYEAQLLVLQLIRKSGRVTESVPIRDLSTPLPVKNCRQILPDVEMNIPRGFI